MKKKMEAKKTTNTNSVSKKEARAAVKARQNKALALWQGLDDSDKDRIGFPGLLEYWKDMSAYGTADIGSAMIYQHHKLVKGTEITPYHALCVIRRIRRILSQAGIPQDQITDLLSSNIGLCRQISRSVKRGYYRQPGRGISPDHALEIVEKLSALEDLRRVRASKSYRFVRLYIEHSERGINLTPTIKTSLGRMASSLGMSTRGFIQWHDWISQYA